MLSIKSLSASIDKKKILSGISFEFEPRKTYAILGPNGSGKSTLAAAILGHPGISLSENTRISFGGTDLKPLPTDKRAALGIFLSFQSPLPLPGVSVADLLRLALDGKVDPLSVRKNIIEFAAELGIRDDLISRSIHDGFSGGERKKIEALQAALLSPKIAIFDELDTGADVDAVNAITKFLKKRLPKDTTRIFITHSPKLLSLVRPDETIVLKKGRIVATGGRELSKKVITEGFEAL